MSQAHSPNLPVAEDDALRDEDVPSSRAEMVAQICRYVALLAAWIATCGSLFFSEVLHWTPCLLCWYQRILMYPLSIILAVGLLRKDRGLPFYVLPLSIIGGGFSLYHYLLQKTHLFPPPACSVTVPCDVDYINVFGFITIPFLALTAFVIITVAIVASMLLADKDEAGAANDDAPRFSFDWAQLAVVVVILVVVVSFVAAAQFV